MLAVASEDRQRGFGSRRTCAAEGDSGRIRGICEDSTGADTEGSWPPTAASGTCCGCGLGSVEGEEATTR